MPRKKTKGLRKDGRYQVQLEIPSADGARRRKTFYGATPEEAKAKRDQYCRETGFLPDQYLSVAEWAKLWMEIYKSAIRDKTREIYQWVLDSKILPVIGDINLLDLREFHIVSMYSKYRGYSASMVHKIHFITQQLLNTAVSNRLMPMNPAQNVAQPKGAKSKEQTALDDITIEIVTNSWNGHYVGIWAMVGLYSGLRPGEWAYLREKHIDFAAAEIQVRGSVDWAQYKINETDQLKTDAARREVPIPPPLFTALSAMRTGDPEHLICAGNNNAVLSKTVLRRGWNKYMHYLNDLHPQNAPIKFPPYTLRHTYRTILYEAGVDPLTAARWMGHEDPTLMIKVYAHLREKQEVKSNQKFIEYFGKRI